MACAFVVLAGLGGGAVWSVVPARALTEGGTENERSGAGGIDQHANERAEAKEAEERQERAEKEAAEREGKEREASEHQAKEREAREAKERAEEEGETAQSQGGRCIVPKLQGDSLAAARKALQKAHCKLGKVSKSSRYRGRLVVIGQGVPAGHKLGKGSEVAVKLGPRSHRASGH